MGIRPLPALPWQPVGISSWETPWPIQLYANGNLGK